MRPRSLGTMCWPWDKTVRTAESRGVCTASQTASAQVLESDTRTMWLERHVKNAAPLETTQEVGRR